MDRFRHEFVDVGPVTLHCAVAGDPGAPLIVCLHGFPEYWAAWREVMARLERDFFLVAPDQRGYNLSSRPAAVSDYRARNMAADLNALAERFSPNAPFVLAGHDWGASVAYAYSIQHPGRLSHLVVANGVHPACFQRAIFEDPEQRAASQYINWLRRPGSDALMAEHGWRRALAMISGFSGNQWMSDEAKEGYIEAWSRPGAMRAMIDWYRASPVEVPEPGTPAGESVILAMSDEALTVRMPHLLIWGDRDLALRPSCIADLPRYAPRLTIDRVPDAGHWILHERPDEVADSIRRFVRG